MMNIKLVYAIMIRWIWYVARDTNSQTHSLILSWAPLSTLVTGCNTQEWLHIIAFSSENAQW